MLQKIGIYLYRFLEDIDGEKGKCFLCYRIAEKIKIWVLINMINERD
jgi:hypothetical protein